MTPMLDFATEVDQLVAEVRAPEVSTSGKLVRVVGLTLEAKGIIAPLGAHCQVENLDLGTFIDAEVVGFQDDLLFLMPFSEPGGVGPGARVWVRSNHSKACLGRAMLGRVVDGQGQPIDGKGPIDYSDQLGLDGLTINPMERGAINQTLDTGIKALNTCLTIGRGQRIGLVAGSGVGKSVLLGMLTRNTEADVVVIGLIGERGREVQEFIHQTLGKEGLAKSVVVAAPANISPVLRLKATNLATLLNFEVDESQSYKIQLLPGAFVDFFENINDTIFTSVRTNELSDYGSLTVILNKPKQLPVIVQLVNSKFKLVREQFIETNKNIVFDYIIPGEYYVRLIYDENENKRWDSGNYLKKKQPENIIYYPTKLEIRANWSLIETFNLE